MIRAEGLSRVFDSSPPWLVRALTGRPQRLLHAVNEVSLEIEQGTTYALVGESGSGKSTLARLLVGLLAPTQGQVFWENTPIAGAGARFPQPLRRRVQMIFQDPYASLNPRHRVAELLAEPLQVFRLREGRKAISQRTEELLAQVGLSATASQKFPHQFSGGQRQRLAIARALACEPDFIVCDEPTSALDVSIQAQILNLLKELQAELGLTYLFITHDLAVVRFVADQIGVMYLGRLIEEGPAAEVFATPRHPYTKLLLEAAPDVRRIGHVQAPLTGEIPDPFAPPAGCPFHTRCPYVEAQCLREVPAWRGVAHRARCWRVGADAATDGD